MLNYRLHINAKFQFRQHLWTTSR